MLATAKVLAPTEPATQTTWRKRQWTHNAIYVFVPSRTPHGLIIIISFSPDTDASPPRNASTRARHQSQESRNDSKSLRNATAEASADASCHKNAPSLPQERIASSRNIRPTEYSARRGKSATSDVRLHVNRSAPPSTDATISKPSTRSVNDNAPSDALSGYPIAAKNCAKTVFSPFTFDDSIPKRASLR